MVQRFTDDFKNVKVVSNVRNVIQSFCNKMKTRLLKSSPHSIVKKCYFDVKVFGYFQSLKGCSKDMFHSSTCYRKKVVEMQFYKQGLYTKVVLIIINSKVNPYQNNIIKLQTIDTLNSTQIEKMDISFKSFQH